MADNLVNRGMAAINAPSLWCEGSFCRWPALPTACDAGEDEVSATWRENFGPPLGSKNGLIHGRRSRAAVALRKERTAASKAARAEVAAAIAQAEAVLRAAGKAGRRAVRAKAKGG